MGDILSKILQVKREEVDRLLQRESLEGLKQKAKKADPVRGFARALKQQVERKKPAIIAEIKRASPSKGLIRPDFDPVAIAKSYAANGATCLSVLTDRPFFQGADEYLVAARAACSLPVLRKDFIIDAAQILEARALGADAILLIVAALSDEQLHDFEDLAFDLGMDVLVEVHDESELERALSLKTPLMGINNRDLKTFEVDIRRCLQLKEKLENTHIVVCESGIHTPQEMEHMMSQEVFAFLIGETFMRASDPGEKLGEWLNQ